MKRRIQIMLSFLLSIMLCMVIGFPSMATEASLHDRVRIMVETYEITEGSVAPGQNFTLKLNLKNISKGLNAQNVVVSVVNNQGIVFPAEAVSNQVLVGDVKGNAEAEVSLKLRVAENAGDAENITLVFYFSFLDVASSEMTDEAYISIPLRKECNPSITELSLADNCYAMENSILSSKITNDGSFAAQNVRLHLTVDGSEELVYELGKISGGITKLYDHTIRMPQAGEQVLSAYLSYEDEQGNTCVTDTREYAVRVLEGTSNMELLETTNGNGLHVGTIIVNVLLVVAAVAIIIVFRRKDMRKITSGKEMGYGKRS